MRVISDVEQIQDLYGFHPIKQLLAPGIRMDDPKMVTPVIAQTGRKSVLVAREQESGNLRAHGVPWNEVKLFERYVSFDNMVNGSDAVHSLVDAIREIAAGDVVDVEGDLPYGRYLALNAELDVRVRRDTQKVLKRHVVYEISNSEVLSRFAWLRRQGAQVAERVIKDRAHLRGIEAYFTSDADTRFESLNKLQGDLGCQAVMLLSPPNFSEVAGIAKLPSVAVVRLKDAESIYLVAPWDSFELPGRVVGVHDSFSAAVASIVGDQTLAVEDGYLDVDVALVLQDQGVSLIPASKHLSRWRELRDHEDLPFAVIAAQASRYCIEGALEFAQTALARGDAVTELDVYQKYLELIAQFRREFDVRFSIEPFFVNCHAADRCVYPALPTTHPLTGSTKTLKFDAGLKVIVDGVVLGTSDIARTMTTTPEAREAYELFSHIVRDKIIDELRPGTICEEVHTKCVDEILRHEERLIELGLMPEGIDLHAEYGLRNVGHLMGKQESFAIEFRPGHSFSLHLGAIGAVEIQWPYGDYSIAAEDLWFVGKDQTFVTSK